MIDGQIPGGNFLISRQIFQSAIWTEKRPLCLKLFLWLIGNAVFRDGHVFKGHVLKRGELITTYAKLAEVLAYRHNHQTIKPTKKELRIMLSWLQSEGMIFMKPLTDVAWQSKGTPKDVTKAYIGLLISVVNYDTYQAAKSYKGTGKGTPSSELGHIRGIKRGNNIKSESNPDFERFYSAYPKREAKKRAIQIWERINPDSNLLETILSAIEKQKIHKAHLKESGQFCPEWPQPGVWLNNERWTDEIQEITLSGGGSKAAW